MDLRDIFGIKYPIIQGGMANIATAEFAAVIANAGALGLIGAGGMSCEQLREQIRLTQSLTDKPFGVNLMLMHPQIDAMTDIVIEEGVKIITTGAGNPAPYIPKWKAAGIKVFPVVPSVALALRMQQSGADGVIVEGTESGGHVGELTTMALVPQVCAALDIPVVAAGGVATGSQMLAAFALGACGVQIGTLLLAAEECPIHDNYKQAVLQAKDTDTVVTGRIGGVPVRILKNKLAREYIKKEKAGVSREELEAFTLGAMRRAVFEGDISTGSVMLGQVAGLVNKCQPAAELLDRLFNDCLSAFDNLCETTMFCGCK
jgi:enoyl-[acyl-carrier protein] reductase II